MKRKSFTKKELRAREALNYLSRRDFMTLGAKAASAAALPSFMATLLRESTAFAEVVNGGVPNYGVVQISLPGGPLEYVLPLAASGDPLSGAALGLYGVKPTIASETNRIVSSMGLEWINRETRDGAGAPVVKDFIGGLLERTALNTDVDMSKVQAFNVRVNSQDDNDTNSHGLHNVFSAAGYKGVLTDAIAVSGGLRATPAINYSLNPYSAVSSAQIQDLISYTPALRTKSPAALTAFASSLQKLGDLQTSRLFASIESEQRELLKNKIDNAHSSNIGYTDPNNFTVSLNIAADTRYQAALNNIFGANTIANNANIGTFATGLRALFKGQTNFLGWSIPQGMDYHDNAAVNNGNGTLEKDLNVGKLVGGIINLAFYENKPTLIVITKDGCCQGNPDHTAPTIATGDRGRLASFIVIAVNAGSATNFTRAAKQIGAARTDNGTVDDSKMISKSDASAASVLGAFVLYSNGVAPQDILKIFPNFITTDDLLAAMALKTS